jgi:hypothetical protein
MINHAMFQRNGRVGYVLKPLALRSSDKTLLARRTEYYLDVTVHIPSSFVVRGAPLNLCRPDHLGAAVASR